jgi:hypothetical protein
MSSRRAKMLVLLRVLKVIGLIASVAAVLVMVNVIARLMWMFPYGAIAQTYPVRGFWNFYPGKFDFVMLHAVAGMVIFAIYDTIKTIVIPEVTRLYKWFTEPLRLERQAQPKDHAID